MKKQQYELIICSVLLNQSELVIKTARENGVTNATSIKGRGTGEYEAQNLMGIDIQPEKEIILMVVPKDKRRKVMQEVAQVAGLNTPADGICFSMPIESWTGTLPKIAVQKPSKVDDSKQISVFDEKAKQNEEKIEKEDISETESNKTIKINNEEAQSKSNDKTIKKEETQSE